MSSSSDNSDSDSESDFDYEGVLSNYQTNKKRRKQALREEKDLAKQRLRLRKERRKRKKTKEQRIEDLENIISKEKDDCEELAAMDRKLDELEANKDDSDYDAELEELEEMVNDIVNKKYTLKF